MPKGSRGGVKRASGGGGARPEDIQNRELITWSGKRQNTEDDFFKTSEAFYNEYGNEGIPQNFFQTADFKGRSASAIAVYDGSNVVLNRRFINDKVLNKAYDESTKSGWSPSRGNKSAAEAVAAHELGHRLTDAVGQKMGVQNLDTAATRIIKEARKSHGKHRGVVQMASKISGYATTSNAEAVAEAVSDVFCNGNRAKSESHAIVNTIKKYL